MAGEVLKYDAACRAIAEAKTVDEVTGWIDKAAAVKEYGRRIENRQIEIDAIEIRVKARRRRGELLAEMKERGQIRRGQPSKVLSPGEDNTFSLEDLGVSRNESSEDQRLAAIPRDSFERLVARCREYAEAHPEKHSFDVLGEGAASDKKAARETRERILGGIQLAMPDKKFGVILADPEWRFKTYSRETGMDRSADNHYPTSETDAICARPVGDIAAADAVLFLWATSPMLPDALRVMAAWGFAYKSHVAWKKDRIGTGYWFRNQHELLLVGTRGKVPAPAMGTQFPSVIDAPLGKHSEKPDAFYELIEAYFPTLPKIELNARRVRAGWESWGNEAPGVSPAGEIALPAHDPVTGELLEGDELPSMVPDAPDPDPPVALEAAAPVLELAAELPSAVEGVAAAAETTKDGASAAAAVTDLAFPETELGDLIAYRDQTEAVSRLDHPEYLRRGLIHDWLGKWRLSPQGEVRIGILQREFAERSALFQARLEQQDFWDWSDLNRLAARMSLDAGSVRSLVGLGFAECSDDAVRLTDAGRARLAELEAMVDEPLPSLPAPSAYQLDIEDLLRRDGAAA